MAAGQKLPAQKQLAKTYGVAPMTVASAIRVLRDEGLLVSSHGRGVFVRGAGSAGDQVADQRLGAEIADLRQEVDGLRRQYGRLEALIIDLYGRTGQPYPHDRSNEGQAQVRRAAGA